MPAISIVLPTYNGEKYLNESIQSIVRQDFSDWELIIIDDCSSDSTPGIIERWKERDSRIHSFRNSKNAKLPGSLNIGFSHATGKYHTWTSDDNVFECDALQIMYDALESHQEFDLVYCDIKRIDQNGELLSNGGFHGTPGMLYFFNVVQACFLYSSKMANDLGGYDTDLFLVEDYDFWLRGYRSFNYLHLSDTPYRYRIHDESLTSTRTKEIRKRASMVLRREARRSELGLGKRLAASIGFLYNAVLSI